MTGLALVLATLCWTPLAAPCQNAKSTSECAAQIRIAMSKVHAGPEKFRGLSANSSYSDFQGYFHRAKRYNCTRPCLSQEEPCAALGPNYPGTKLVMWVRKHELPEHPTWFPELSATSSDKDIATALYMRGHHKTPRVCEVGEEEGHFVPFEKSCHNGGPESHCAAEVVNAMLRGFSEDPSKFVGLTVKSSFSDFQAYFHNAGMHHCRRPCLPQEQPCTIFGQGYPGLGDIFWVRSEGIVKHPDWYPDLTADSSNEDIARALYMRGVPSCKRVCDPGESAGHFVQPDLNGSLLSESWMSAQPTQRAVRTGADSTVVHVKKRKRKLPDAEVEEHLHRSHGFQVVPHLSMQSLVVLSLVILGFLIAGVVIAISRVGLRLMGPYYIQPPGEEFDTDGFKLLPRPWVDL